jgi:precorrin-6B methylase 2
MDTSTMPTRVQVAAGREPARTVGQPTPDDILQIGLGFWASKVLLSAIELGLFTALGSEGATADELAGELGLHVRSRDDFLDALVALGMLERTGCGGQQRYANTPATALFLDRQSPAYLGGMLEMANARLYRFWGNLTEAVQTGEPQNEIKVGEDLFEALYQDERRLEQFLVAMQGLQMGAVLALLEAVDLTGVGVLCDIGGANGALAATAARRYPALRAVTFDLPAVQPIARRNLEDLGVADRVDAVAGDFFADDLPRADIITMGNILHDWDEDKKLTLIRKAYDALPPGGRLVVIENIIDDERRTHAFGLLMSLNMLIETRGGFDFTGRQFDQWCRAVGFGRTEVVPLAGPTSAAIAYR